MAAAGRGAPPTRLDRAAALLAGIVLVALAAVLPPRPWGDAAEYLLMAESWAAHGSPELRPGDVASLRARAAAALLALDPDDALGNYFQGRDGRFYSYHFWAYPLLTLPARLALRAAGADELRAGPLTNALLFAGAVAAALLAPGPAFARRALAALLLSSPALGLLLWPHPEVLSFAAATLALLAGARGAHGLAVLWAAVASLQNPPLLVLVAFSAVRPWLADERPAWSWPHAVPAALGVLVAAASPLFYLALFSTPSMVAGQATGVQPMSAGRALGLLFDLELGLVRYAPLTVALALALLPRLARGRFPGTELPLLAVLAALTLAASATGNWNHGTSGPSRYVAWLFPAVAYLLTLGPTAAGLLQARRPAYRAALAAVVVAQAGVALARGGPLSPLDYLEHSTPARLVLDHRPAWYDPDHEVFRERTAGSEKDDYGPFVHEHGGRCRKALARWRHAQTLRARCGELPEASRPFFDSHPSRLERSRWIYVDYP